VSSEKKAASLGAVTLAVLALIGSSQFLEFARWATGEVRVFWQLPLFGAVVVATFVGAVTPAWLPYYLPDTWSRRTTLRVTRLLASGIAFVMVAGQYRSAIGVQYACFAASGAYVAWTVCSNAVYQRWPHLQPPSLVDEDVFCSRVRANAERDGRRRALTDVLGWAVQAGEDHTEVARRARAELEQ
jgi:hypothetical protein